MNLKEWVSQYTTYYNNKTNDEILAETELILEYTNIKKIKHLDPCIMDFEGALILANNEIEEIPEWFEHRGWLNLQGNNIKEIPKHFKQAENQMLILGENPISRIPEHFEQRGDLIFTGMGWEDWSVIPEGFIQTSGLWLGNNKFKVLPESFKQGSYLYLENNLIETIEKGFVQTEHILVLNNPIKEIYKDNLWKETYDFIYKENRERVNEFFNKKKFLGEIE